jgi:hypothetical protein
MRSRITKKNPFMSLWLSSANQLIAPARGQAMALAQRQIAAMQAEAMKQMVGFWTGQALPAAPARRRKRR